MVRAHRLDAPGDEKAALLHQSISRELDALCRYCVIPPIATLKRWLYSSTRRWNREPSNFVSLIRTMLTPDPNTPTPETGSEKGTNTTGVARSGFSTQNQKSKPAGKIPDAGKKGAKAKIISKDPPELRRSSDQRSHRGPTEHWGRQCALPPNISSRGAAGVRESEVSG
ncbi:hypothetical protein E4U19_002756 [Claviceps sp. Clav32 group G5]|nr:hypothetical protein E4U19_002756 [Claviceps sp. Clav32 group G5]